MNNFKHLTQNQILAYADDLLRPAELKEIRKHLLKCTMCRRSFPRPTAAQYQSALMTEWEEDETLVVRGDSSPQSIFSPFLSLMKSPSALAWSSGALILALSVSTLFWLKSENPNKDIVGSFKVGNEADQEINFPLPAETPSANKRIISANSNLPVAESTRHPQKQKYPSGKVEKDPERKILREKREGISETRGSGEKCEERAVQLELIPDQENFVFKWKKVPNANKYHLYISDENEILVDEYETARETNFMLKKPLDPAKTYKWKIVITLDNGKTVDGGSHKFTVKDFPINHRRTKKKGKSDSRCSANG